VNTQTDLIYEPPAAGADPVDVVIRALGLTPRRHPAHAGAVLLERNGLAVAAIVFQRATFREDRLAIEALKAHDRELPIIYVASGGRPRRETAIRRLCIHYFLADPVECEELRLVLDVLLRSAEPSSSYERYFTR
jgi:hypothetical protein